MKPTPLVILARRRGEVDRALSGSAGLPGGGADDGGPAGGGAGGSLRPGL